MNSDRCVVIVNTGGIGKIGDIPRFLFNMFSDARIVPAPGILRSFIAFLITMMRAKDTFRILNAVGGSPIFEITKKQAEILRKKTGVGVCYAFRYSYPSIKRCCKNPIIVPMYTFYSHTTHGSIMDYRYHTKPPLCIYPEFMELMVKKIKDAINDVPHTLRNKTLVLLSAHSIPLGLSENRHDPYKRDLEIFTNFLKKRIGIDIRLSFQSKLGPIRWLEPSTVASIKNASKQYKSIIVVPISFTSENTETVYEIDKIYSKLAKSCGFEYFYRVPCLNYDDKFMSMLAEEIKRWI